MTEDSAQEVRITYETLYELLRREKSHEELQKLDESFFKDVLNYLEEKHKILQEAAGKFDMFSVDERDNTQVQLNNVRRILKELYERREKKILDMALNKSRTNSNIIDTANLLDKEKSLYMDVLNVLDSFRKDILFALLEMKETEPNVKQENKEQKTEPKIELEPEKTIEKPEPKAEASKQEQKTTKKIKFTQKVEEFVGPDLETIGPFEQEQVKELPVEIADILINNGSAVIAE